MRSHGGMEGPSGRLGLSMRASVMVGLNGSNAAAAAAAESVSAECHR